MLFNVKLSQVNKANDVTFNASKKIQSGEEMTSIAKEISSFCLAFSKLTEKNKKRGYNNNNGIRKSQTMTMVIQGIGEDKDIVIELSFRNFGRFVLETTEANLKGLLAENINFLMFHGDWKA